MKSSTNDDWRPGVTFLKATFIGGLLFLLPVAVIAFLLGQALRLAIGIVSPIIRYAPEPIAGTGFVPVIAAASMVLASLLAGLFARTATGRRVMTRLEGFILGGLPQYRLMKRMAENLAEIESSDAAKPILVAIEDGWQLGYQMEVLDNGWVVAFLPQAPAPTSGNVMYVDPGRVRPLAITMLQAMTLIKRLGSGSAELLKGVAMERSKA